MDRLLREAQDVVGESVGGTRGDIVAAEMSAACRLAHLGLQRLAVEHNIPLDGVAPAAPSDAEIESVVDAQRAAWLLSSRPGGLDDSIAKILR